MVALEVWFDQVPENDFGTGDPAIIVDDLTGLDELIEHVLTVTEGRRIPSVVQANISGQDGLPIVEAGISHNRGFISYTDHNGGFYSVGDTSRSGDATYDYMGNEHVVPASAEIPLSEVRQWLADFIATGGPSVTIPLMPDVS
ncbi:Imm1 family immunity protein [Solwaraspora sp. WMMA2056]|uniref:Imm1 family immunity protein n=1 Tax=Solwaraspora sp. WMMA2056 TaxID=3015161 RepID=UPI00259B78B9|nr:Imm1 family immunity protein [Solwaraspora sp. WMMA2056]WJK41578.1 Imm1 family immunity protein [Solwaraspora sp. WMMA2056]